MAVAPQGAAGVAYQTREVSGSTESQSVRPPWGEPRSVVVGVRRSQCAPRSLERATIVGMTIFAGAGTGLGSTCSIGP
jgi:hypothetical protein